MLPTLVNVHAKVVELVNNQMLTERDVNRVQQEPLVLGTVSVLNVETVLYLLKVLHLALLVVAVLNRMTTKQTVSFVLLERFLMMMLIVIFVLLEALQYWKDSVVAPYVLLVSKLMTIVQSANLVKLVLSLWVVLNVHHVL
jgi:hypothetical protein